MVSKLGLLMIVSLTGCTNIKNEIIDSNQRNGFAQIQDSRFIITSNKSFACIKEYQTQDENDVMLLAKATAIAKFNKYIKYEISGGEKEVDFSDKNNNSFNQVIFTNSLSKSKFVKVIEKWRSGKDFCVQISLE